MLQPDPSTDKRCVRTEDGQKREEKSRKEEGAIADLLKNNKLLHGRVERPS